MCKLLKIILKFFIFISIFTDFSFSAVLAEEREYTKVFKIVMQDYHFFAQKYLLQEKLSYMARNGVLVHLTDVFPETRKLKAGMKLTGSESMEVQYLVDNKIIPNTRPTLHFTVDKAFDPHRLNPGKYPYAVLIPVGCIDLSRIHTGYYDDLIIVGDVELRDGTIILAPEYRIGSLMKESDKKVSSLIHSYPSKSDCRGMVNEYLKNYYSRPIIKDAGNTLELFNSFNGNGEIVVNDSFFTTTFFSKENLNPYKDQKDSYTFSFFELGDNLLKSVPITGSGFMWLNEPHGHGGYNRLDLQEDQKLSFIKRKILVGDEIFEAKQYYEKHLGLKVEKWELHENTTYSNLENTLGNLFSLYELLLFREKEQTNEELIETLFKKYNQNLYRNNDGSLEPRIFKKIGKEYEHIIKKLSTLASENLKIFYDAELEKSQEIKDIYEKNNQVNFLNKYFTANNIFIGETLRLSHQIAKGNYGELERLQSLIEWYKRNNKTVKKQF